MRLFFTSHLDTTMSSLATIDGTATGSLALFDTIAEMGHEQVVMCYDKSSGYRGVIAIHDTTLGPALGGARFWQYASDEEAIIDALRLSRGMTYKNAVAGSEPRWRKVRDHRRQPHDQARDDLPRARPLRRFARRPLHHRRRRRHEHRRHGLRAHGDEVRHRSREQVRRPVARDGAWRVPRDPGVRQASLGLGLARGQGRSRYRASATSATTCARSCTPAKREADRHRHRCVAGEARRRRVRRAGRWSTTASSA